MGAFRLWLGVEAVLSLSAAERMRVQSPPGGSEGGT